jgi:hypothetical protein
MNKEAYAAVFCRGDLLSTKDKGCGKVIIDKDEYMRQMRSANSLWCCPSCGGPAIFDDDYYESLHFQDDDSIS